ncbi:MAG: GNAT family N-acetyltransferase [Bacteroidota bacterium]
MIQTPRLLLVPANLPLLEAASDGNLPELSALLGGVQIEPDWTSFPDAIVWMRDFMREFAADINWWNYMTIHRTDKKLIGACGFKGEPDPEGMVELGYEIASAYRGRGLATEAAQGLLNYAFSFNSVEKVTATTLAEENASTRLLRRLHFTFTGEETDLEDGKIWTWCKNRAEDVSRSGSYD